MSASYELRKGDEALFHGEQCHNISTVTCGIRQSIEIVLLVAAANKVDKFGSASQTATVELVHERSMHHLHIH